MPAGIATTEDFYLANRHEFEMLEHFFEARLGVPQEIARDTVKRSILAQVNEELPRYFDQAPTVSRFWAWYGITAVYFLLQTLVGRFTPATLCRDVIFDGWEIPAIPDFYARMQKALTSFSTALWVDRNQCTRAEVREFASPPVCRDVGRRYNRNTAWRLFKATLTGFPALRPRPECDRMNLAGLAMRMLKQVLLYETEIAGLACRAWVSAHDNGYNALRYHVFRRHCAGLVFLIQNGGRVNLASSGNSYIYCDFYLGWSAMRNIHFHGLCCEGTFEVGSFRLANSMGRPQLGERRLFDVLFVEQLCADKQEPCEFEPDLYLKAVENLVKFAEIHPELRVGYKTLKSRGHDLHRRAVMPIDRLLTGSRVVVDGSLTGDVYEAIARSGVIVAFNSSTRHEALMLDRRVLSCNYMQYEYDFLFGDKDAPCVLFSSDYASFEIRLLALLDDANPELDAYFSELRPKAGRTSPDTPEKAAAIVRGYLSASALPPAAAKPMAGKA